MPSSPPSMTPGSSSGLLNPVHFDSMFSASLLIPSLNSPCMFADSSRRGPAPAPTAAATPPVRAKPPVVDDLLMADNPSLVKRSEMDFSWRRLGRRMWTSGSGHLGSWIPSTEAAEITRTGIS